jgi:hypothetical protein
MRAIETRDATATDVATLLRLIHGAVAEYAGRLDPPSDAQRPTSTVMEKEIFLL